MENINLLYLLPVIITTLISFVLLLYWKAAKRLTLYALAYAMLAYFLAIGSKTIFQELTYKALVSVTTSNVALGLYFGLQTMLLEVGLAYVFARIALSNKGMTIRDASGYGVSLAFRENGVMLGVLPIISVLVSYALLSSANAATASAVYNSILASQPQLFSAPHIPVLLSNTLYSAMERTSSILLHASWGILVVLAAALRRKKYLMLAMPMGLIDFLVPFAKVMTVPVFETVILALSVLSIIVTLLVMKGVKNEKAQLTVKSRQRAKVASRRL